MLPITLIVRSDEVGYDRPCSASCNKIKLQSNKTFSAWTIPGLRLIIFMTYVIPSLLYESLDYAQSEKNTPVHVYAHVGPIKAFSSCRACKTNCPTALMQATVK